MPLQKRIPMPHVYGYDAAILEYLGVNKNTARNFMTFVNNPSYGKYNRQGYYPWYEAYKVREGLATLEKIRNAHPGTQFARNMNSIARQLRRSLENIRATENRMQTIRLSIPARKIQSRYRKIFNANIDFGSLGGVQVTHPMARRIFMRRYEAENVPVRRQNTPRPNTPRRNVPNIRNLRWVNFKTRLEAMSNNGHTRYTFYPKTSRLKIVDAAGNSTFYNGVQL